RAVRAATGVVRAVDGGDDRGGAALLVRGCRAGLDRAVDVLRAGARVHVAVGPFPDAADAVRGLAARRAGAGDRGGAPAGDLRSAAVHVPVQPDRLAGRVGAVRL